jgi:restriction endonuclease S subunit
MEDPELRESALERKAITESMVVPEYLALILRSDIVFGQLVYQVTGVGRPRVNKSTILNLQIPLPPEEIQREIINAHNQAREQYADCMRRIEDLKDKGEAALNGAREYTVQQICPED